MTRRMREGAMPAKNWRWHDLKKSFALFPVARGGFASAAFLRPHYARRAEARPWARRALDGMVGSAFRLWVGRRASAVAARWGLGDEWAGRAAEIGRVRFADPLDLALFAIRDAADLDQYMRRFEHAPLNRLVNPKAWEPDCALRDKRAFRARCEAAGLPAARRLAECRGGRVETYAAAASWPIIVKPLDGAGGLGVTLFTPEERQSSARLGEALAGRFGTKADWVAEVRLGNHPAIRPLSLDALSTARVTTMLDEGGSPEIVTTVLRFPARRGVVVDNIKAGGLIAEIEPETGRLGPGRAGRGPGEFAAHPESGAPIPGLTLPFWEETKALALRAHEDAFGDYALVGWDMAITEAGPVIIEGNGFPCIIVAQRGGGRGLGETRYGALYAHHLAARRSA